MAEYFRDRGQHALVVIDDLSKHAATHRELALLMQQPPGREAYPGDIFHLHARLLERAAMLSKEQGGGSLTALPIAQTEAGNLAAYIPTNLISITDGQIVLDAKQFHLGQLPAVDTGLSVSRVGGKTQAPLMREAVSSLRLEYAQFQELEQFTRFGTQLDPKVHQQIARGRRIRAALAQPRLVPQSVATQIALVIALQAGLFDAVMPADFASAVERLAQALEGHPELCQRLAVRTAVDAEERESLQRAIERLMALPKSD
jgi:F-type H+/Na+-transporting ATPase subunit alpha